MKNILKVVVGILVMASVALYIYFAKPSVEKKSSNFKSYQKEMKIEMTPSQVAARTSSALPVKKDLVESNTATSKRVIANKFMRENPVLNYLDQKIGRWSWSPDVFVIEETKYKGSKDNIVGNHDGYIVVKDGNKPQHALNLIYNSTEKRLGIFMEQIAILHEKSSEFELKLQKLTGDEIQYVTGVYFIKTSSLPIAFETLAKIQKDITTVKADLDVNYAIQRAN